MRHTDAILRFLDGLGRASDGQFYLGLFHSLPRESFAILSIDGSVVRESLDALVLDLRYLYELDLYPMLVFGLLDAERAAEHAEAAVRALAERGVRAEPLGEDGPPPGEALRDAVMRGVLPVVALGASLPVDERFRLVAAVIRELKTRKLIFVRSEGRIGRSREDRISVVNLATDLEALNREGALPPDQRLLLAELATLFEGPMPHRLLAAVTSPLNLLKELFTVKGGGTLVKRGGVIRRHEGFAGVDRDRFTQLLETSFGKRLRSSFFEKPVTRVYLEEAYRGAAVIAETPVGPYLTKFAVEAQAQGEGLGRDLWQAVIGDHRELYWRAKPENRILPFYVKTCEGMARFAEWHVFWVGTPPERLPETLRHALAMERDFVE